MEENDVAQNLGLEFGIYSVQILTEMLFILYSIPLGKVRKIQGLQQSNTSYLF